MQPKESKIPPYGRYLLDWGHLNSNQYLLIKSQSPRSSMATRQCDIVQGVDGVLPQVHPNCTHLRQERRLSSSKWNLGYLFTIIEMLAARNQINMAAWPMKGAYPEAV
jgi:hypothetical protein